MSCDDLQPWQEHLLEEWNANGGNATTRQGTEPPKSDDGEFVAPVAAARKRNQLRGAEVISAIWHEFVLPSGHSGLSVDKLVRSTIGHLGANPTETQDLLQQGRVIAWRADKQWKGDCDWSEFILQRLRWELPDCLMQMRKQGYTGGSCPPATHTLTARPIKSGRRTVIVDFDHDDDSLASGRWAAERQPPLVDQASTQQILEILRKDLSPEDFNILELLFGLNCNDEHSARELGKRLDIPHATANRKAKRALRLATSIFVLREEELAELTGELTSYGQVEQLKFMGIPYRTRQNGSVVVLRDDLKRRRQKRAA
jgi:DNA-directed RNA polymerase specialized sigma24 family protein